MSRGQTPSQTIGPFFAYGLTAPQYEYAFTGIASDALAGDEAPGERVRIVGNVFDGAGEAVPDAMIEVWQADGEGRYAHPADGRGSNRGFRGFGRLGTGADARRRFHFRTVKPASVDGVQAPHINVIVFMRGMLTHAYTRLYFPDESDANNTDPVLRSVPETRRHTLIAARDEDEAGVVYRFDIHMQGDRETVFFDV